MMKLNRNHSSKPRRSRRIVPGFLILALLLAAITAFSWPLSANERNGVPPLAEQDDWRLIEFEGQLWTIEDNPTGKYRLKNDLDLGGYENWRPIGRSRTTLIPFKGQFDGAGFTIRNLKITGDTLDNAGFFAQIDPAGLVENLAFQNANVEGRENVGILAGVCRGTVKNVASAGSAAGAQYAGGLVGLLDGGTVHDSSSTADVGGGDRLGGLVGLSRNGEIQRSRASGDVFISGDFDHPGSAGIGGLVGQATEDVRISECFATGNVPGDYGSGAGGLIGSVSSEGFSATISDCFAVGGVGGTKIGGLVGWINSPVVISRCFAAGRVASVPPQTRGGLVGQLDIRATLADSYYDRETSGVNRSIGDGIPKSTAEMECLATYEGWSIEKYTPQAGGEFADFHYPLLRFAAATSGAAGARSATTWVLNEREPPLPLPDPMSGSSSGCSAGNPSALFLLLLAPLPLMRKEERWCMRGAGNSKHFPHLHPHRREKRKQYHQ